MTLEEWAKKAREALGNRRFITSSGGPDEYDEDFNDDEVIDLCNEYDELMKGPTIFIQASEYNPLFTPLPPSWIGGNSKF